MADKSFTERSISEEKNEEIHNSCLLACSHLTPPVNSCNCRELLIGSLRMLVRNFRGCESKRMKTCCDE